MTRRTALLWAGLGATSVTIGALPGCARVAVEPIEVKPIQITLDVNIRVQRELDQFFSFEDKLLTGDGKPAASAPATQPAPAAADAHK